MDILQLVDRLETMLSKGWRIPFTSNIVIHEDPFLDVIDQMRISIPEEVKQARRVHAERERMLEQAQQEAERVVASAREQVTSLSGEEEVVKLAQAKADEIVAQAHRSSESIKAEADAYVMEVLSDMEEQLMKLITTVRNGIQQVERSASTRGTERRPQSATGKGDGSH
jgi:cell division septum initiation protein DivIVA